MKPAITTEKDKENEEASIALSEDAPPARLETFLNAKGIHLLLVEDECADAVLACNLVEESMPDYRWDIRVASSIGEAISLLASDRFDLALVDLGLRDIEGPKTVEMLCMVAPYVPIVVYSGTENDAVLEAALRKGAFVCLQKNKTPPDLMRTALVNAMSRDAAKL